MNTQDLRSGSVLVLGDGDFTFSWSLALAGCASHGLIATSFDSYDTVVARYASAEEAISFMTSNGVSVLHGVDATKLKQTLPASLFHPFRSIIFNFPHVGGKSNIEKNRQLLSSFFGNLAEFTNDDTSIYVTLARGQGGTKYDESRLWGNHWQIVSKAARYGFILEKVVPFDAREFMVYQSRGYRSLNKSFQLGGSLTHVFRKLFTSKHLFWPDINSYYSAAITRSAGVMVNPVFKSVAQLDDARSSIDLQSLPLFTSILHMLAADEGMSYFTDLDVKISADLEAPFSLPACFLRANLHYTTNEGIEEVARRINKIVFCHVHQSAIVIHERSSESILATFTAEGNSYRVDVALDVLCAAYYHVHDYRLLWSDNPLITSVAKTNGRECCSKLIMHAAEYPICTYELSIWLMNGLLHNSNY